MCQICDARRSSRRGFLSLAVAGVATGLAVSHAPAWAASGPATNLTADQALTRLKEGNARYVKEPQMCAAQLSERRSSVSKHQAPWATIVSCADSRVPPELLFGGVGVGELFVARNAGNMADTATMGTIEYGSAVLGVPLIVVLGHDRCGAVAAACDVVKKDARFPGSIHAMVWEIVPAAKAVADQQGDFVKNAVRESAARTAQKIGTESPLIADLVKAGKVKIVAGRYDLDEGRVEFFS